MNVLQINTADTKGGAAKVAYSLKQELEKRGHQTSMFVARKYSDKENVKILNDVRSFSGRIRKKLAFYLANDIDVFRSDQILKTEEFKKADIIHCHNLHSNYFNLDTLTKISAQKPVIWTFHDMWPLTAHCGHSFDGKIKPNGFFTCPSLEIYPPIAWHNEKYLEVRKANIYRKSNFHIVTPSQWLAGKVGQSLLADKPLTVIYNGIDTKIFHPFSKEQVRTELDLPQGKKIILIVAKRRQSNPWKGGNYAQEAVRAFVSDSSAFLVDLGGDASQSIDGVKTVSFVANQAILAKYYAAADILLYPSVADNCPLVVLEAMACGLPIVAFETGGVPELVEHKKTGYIAEYKDVNDLISGVNYLLNLGLAEHQQMGRQAIEKIKEKFTLEKMAEQYFRLYNRVLS